MVVKVVLRAIGLYGRKVEIRLCDTVEEMKSMTVQQLKKKICEQQGTPEEKPNLSINNTKLEDNKYLSDYGIAHMSEIYYGLTTPGGGTAPDEGGGGMGDKQGQNRSKEKLADF